MLPVLVEFGSFKLPSWGLFVMIGFLLAVWRASKVAPRYGFSKEHLWDCCMIGLLGGIVGGRLVYVALDWNAFKHNIPGIFAVWTGGMTSFGGLIGGLGAGLLAARTKHWNLGDAADLAAPSLAIGYAVGRIGCLLNGCCYGGHCDLPWAMSFHKEGADKNVMTGPAHPTQIYESLATWVAFALLVWLEKRRKFRGQIILAYTFLFSVIRFWIEALRADATASRTGLGGMTHAQVACIVMAALAAGFYAYLASKSKRAPADATP